MYFPEGLENTPLTFEYTKMILSVHNKLSMLKKFE
jgi:hypothetical protein